MRTISVCIPNFNHARYLPECLDGILKQSLQPIEILIIDDCSTDESVDVIKEYQSKFPLISLLRQHRNLGLSSVINIGISLAKGDVLALCAADDIILPGFFWNGMNLFAKHPDVGICFGDISTIRDVKPYQPQIQKSLPGQEIKIYTPQETIRLCRKHLFTVPSQAALYNRAILMRYRGYPQRVGPLCDFFLNNRIALRHPIAYIPHLYAHVRISPYSLGGRYRKKIYSRYLAVVHFIQEYLDEDLDFQKKFHQSRLFAKLGWFGMGISILFPRIWSLLPGAMLNRIRMTFKKFWTRC